MAIAFARARYIGRSTGGVAVRSAAYNAREAITDERTGELYYFKHRDAPEHHEVLLPDGADAKFAESAVLWNAAEGAEKRKDAQVAREIVMALPANHELSHEDRVEMVRSFAQTHFVSRGLAVQLDVHGPHVGDEEKETANHHAHLLITTRRVEGDHLSSKKARDLDPEVRQLGARAAVTDGEAWGALWRDHQNRYFAEHGLDVRVDEVSAVPQQHVGPVRMRAPDSAAVERDQEIAKANALAARDPDKVLEVLTRNNATFTERELDRHLAKHIHDEAVHLAVKSQVLQHGQTLALHDGETGELNGRYTTRAVREQERAALADAASLVGAGHKKLGERARGEAVAARTLRPDQQVAFEYATDYGGLKVIEGRAGTGKSYTLAAVRDAHERGGYVVVGLAPTNSVAQDLKADGFASAATVHSELFRLKNGRTTWNGRTLVVVDEAAMLDSKVMGELLAEAKRSGAKVILAGDDRQLASIERGGLFTELRQRHGSAEITEVTRQKVDWQRRAARDMAEGRVAEAVGAFAREGAVTWTQTQDQARDQLVARWTADTAHKPDAARFVFAYSNKDVDALNASLREVRKSRGELGSKDFALVTKHGEAQFAVGDRVQFTDTLRAAKIYNGNAGVITAIDPSTGVVRAQLDGAAGREVVWSTSEFEGFRHGYAGTIYKGQGKTLDHTYLYHSHHWRQASSYVALTRQRESAQIFVATETARDVAQLARQMNRGEVRSASVAWLTHDELPPQLRQAKVVGTAVSTTVQERSGGAAAVPPEVRSTKITQAGDPGGGSVPEHGWLIAPRTDIAPIDRGEVASAVVGDPQVQRAREALGRYLTGAYRDPREAHSRLSEMVKTHGHTSAAQRLCADPDQLGELQGRVGL
ncbi:MAG: AAA family ATPase, partial [Caulobacteraceae bacterium]